MKNRLFLLASALLCALAASLPTLAQNVGLNADGTTAHPSAILDMTATDKGVLVPRMTQAQRDAVAAPATGLLVFQTDNTPGFYYYNGTAWVPIGGASGWALTGNAATATDFLGTTTNQPLRFRANNLEHARLTQRGALELGLGSSGNVFIGRQTGAATNLGNGNVQSFPNTFLGDSAGRANTTGAANTFLGAKAGRANLSGRDNLFAGNEAGRVNTSGLENVMLGSGAGFSNTSGSGNVFLGRFAGRNNTMGGRNVFLGYLAGNGNLVGSDNTFVGQEAGLTNTASGNVFLGSFAGRSTTSGGANTFVGNEAGRNNIAGEQNTFLGFTSGYSNTNGMFNTFLGIESGYNNETGEINVFLGRRAGYNNTTASSNVFVGASAGQSTTSGASNVYVGTAAGLSNTTGTQNVFLGQDAGRDNIGSGNVFLGFRAGEIAAGSNLLYIDNSPTNIPLIWGDFANNAVGINRVVLTTSTNALEVGGTASKTTAGDWLANSDRRIKADIRPVDNALATLLRVRPVRFRYSPEWLRRHPGIKDRVYYNVIAQEYREVFPDDVKGSGEYLEAGGEEILQVDTYSSQVVAIRAIQELAAEVEALEKENAVLKDKLGQAESKLGENEKTQAKVQELEAKQAQAEARQAQTEAKLNEVLRLLQAAAPGGGK
jgi:hypothetical protein